MAYHVGVLRPGAVQIVVVAVEVVGRHRPLRRPDVGSGRQRIAVDVGDRPERVVMSRVWWLHRRRHLASTLYGHITVRFTLSVFSFGKFSFSCVNG